MMLSIGRVGPGGSEYYLGAVARTPQDYYLGAGEARGWWAGSATNDLGLEGEVDADDFIRLLDGRHPGSGERLVPGEERRVGGFDLTFSAPKSVSLLWALHPDGNVAAQVAHAHRAAIADALAYLEGNALWARRGAGGHTRVAVAGMVAAGFDHRSSRAGDPQLHTHVVVANMVADHSGRWSAPDGRALYRHARTAGFIYQARLRHDLVAQLGLKWGPVRSGQADLAGISREVIERFSTRRAQVRDALASRGLSSSAAARVATLDTRPAKAEVGGIELRERWAALAQAAGVDVGELDVAGLDVAGLVGPGRRPTGPAPEQLVDRLVGPHGLTAHGSTFDRRAVLCALAGEHGDGATLAGLSELADLVVGSPAVADLGPGHSAGAEQRWSTVELLALEADIERRAQIRPAARASEHRAQGGPVGVAEPVALGRALEARPHLSVDQVDAVAGMCLATAAVVTVVGKAGTGKTFALDAARDAWSASGVAVLGAALAARAAAELEAGSGIASTTLARLLGDIERPEARLVPGSVIVVDEAGMVGTRDLHRLIAAAGDQRAKVVLVGDPAQLPEISAGGSFARLAALVPTYTLTVNRRQSQAWERAALDELRDHLPRPALARYGARGRVTLAATNDELRAQMIDDWAQARGRGDSVVMLALRRADVADLNRRAQEHLVATGALDPDRGCLELARGQRVLVGDEIVCGRNDRGAGLINGTALRVTGVDPQGHTITATGVDGQAVLVPGTYVDQGHVALGYASTVHKAQGRTVDTALLLGDDRLFAEAGYVGLSRGRTQNQLYVVADDNPLRPGRLPGAGLAEHVCQALGVSRAQSRASDGVEDRIPDGPLPLLVAERNRLTDRLLATMAPRATTRFDGDRTVIAGEVITRDRWTVEHRRDGERLARLAAAIDRRCGRLGLAALMDPSDHVTGLIGAPPETPGERRVWTDTAASLEAWRELSGRSAERGARHLLAEPARDRPEHEWWQRATRRVEHYQSHHHHDQTLHHNQSLHHDLDAGHSAANEAGFDRSWQTDTDRSLSR